MARCGWLRTRDEATPTLKGVRELILYCVWAEQGLTLQRMGLVGFGDLREVGGASPAPTARNYLVRFFNYFLFKIFLACSASSGVLAFISFEGSGGVMMVMLCSFLINALRGQEKPSAL